MLQVLKNRRAEARDNDKGFTLIELMVVVLIIAILLAIAIPTFLGAQNKSKERSAQSSARNALTAAKTIYADTGLYTAVDPAALLAVEPSLTYALGTVVSSGPKNVSVVATATSVTITVLSDNKKCFSLMDSASGTTYAKDQTEALCKAFTPGTLSTTGW